MMPHPERAADAELRNMAGLPVFEAIIQQAAGIRIGDLR